MHGKTRWIVVAALTLSGAAVGCAGGEEEEDLSRELYDLSIAGDAYKSWQMFPGAATELYASGQHNGDFVRSYMNDVAFAAVSGFSGEFPDGSILVKEQYADAAGETLNGHTVMWKRAGYDPEHGDWYWVAYTGAGATTKHNGQAPYCYDCHAAVKATDWVFTSFQ
jgi:hypothetical protein